MAYTTIMKDSEPWMLCHWEHGTQFQQRIAEARAEAPTATITHRMSSSVETQQCADAMEAKTGLTDDPFAFFAVKVSDLPTLRP